MTHQPNEQEVMLRELEQAKVTIKECNSRMQWVMTCMAKEQHAAAMDAIILLQRSLVIASNELRGKAKYDSQMCLNRIQQEESREKKLQDKMGK
jgi:hypothetical protein